jgi:hypothetical protein
MSFFYFTTLFDILVCRVQNIDDRKLGSHSGELSVFFTKKLLDVLRLSRCRADDQWSGYMRYIARNLHGGG